MRTQQLESNMPTKTNGTLNDYQSFWILDAHMRESANAGDVRF
jgi:hypothetical protein